MAISTYATKLGGVNGLYVAKAGLDVTTCAQQDLIFDSRLGNYASVVTSGVMACGQTIYFGDLGYVPQAYAWILNTNTVLDNRRYWSRIIYESEGRNFQNDSGAYSTGAEVVGEPRWRVTSSSFTLVANGFSNQSGQYADQYNARFVVWRMPG